MSTLLWRDGRPCERAEWLPLERAVQVGDGLLETARVHEGRVLFWGYHQERMLRSAARSGADVGGLAAALKAALKASVAAVKAQAGSGAFRVMAWPLAAGWSVCVELSTYAPLTAEEYAAGVSLGVVPHAHPQQGYFGKTLSRDWAERAKRWARGQGLDAPLFVAPSGALIESSDANILCFDGAAWHTPEPALGGLEGTTIRALRASGLPIRDSRIGVDELGGMSALVLVSSLRLAMGVRSLDGRVFDSPDATAQPLRARLLL